MTSPVDTSVKIFTSDMVGAPVLNGTAGSLIALLDACLVTGFGQQTATNIVVASGVATVTFPTAFPAKVDSVILIAGATGGWVALNGEQKVTALASNVVRFATALADGTATGTITVRMAPAGWSKPYTGTNLAAFKIIDPAAHGGGMYLRVDDTDTQFARVIGYEVMSAISTGTGPFPTTAQINGGLYWVKSTAANSTANAWILAADSRTLLIHIAPGIGAYANAMSGTTRGFGDIISRRPSGDAFGVFLNGSITAYPPSMWDDGLDVSTGTASSASTVLARNISGLGSAEIHRHVPLIGTNTGLSGADFAFGPMPNSIDGSVMLSRRSIATLHNGAPSRGLLPGLYSVPQSGGWPLFSLFDTLPGQDTLSGRNLIAFNPTSTSLGNASAVGNSGVGFIDITGPWR